MLSNKPFALMAAALAIVAVPASAKNPMVGGAAMYSTKNIVQNAVNSRDHTTLVAAVKAAGLVETLSSKGPFTVFAPTNRAFAKLPAGTVETLVKPENKGTLTTILTYHVVPGRITAGQITALAARNKGVARLKTVQGGTLKFSKHGKGWMITDAKGGTAMIAIAMLSLAGLPPFPGFAAKFLIFKNVMAAGYTTYAVLGLVGSYLGIYFYLRVIQLLFMTAGDASPTEQRADGMARTAGVLCLVGTLMLAVFPGWVLERL